MYDENAVSEQRIQEWFARFRCGNIDIEDAPLQMQSLKKHARYQEIALGGTKHQLHFERADYKKKDESGETFQYDP